jgi:hypothetical protein
MPIPPWLEPYVDDHDPARDSLTTPQQVLFDTLWDRACGNATPGLSSRERASLIKFLASGRDP